MPDQTKYQLFHPLQLVIRFGEVSRVQALSLSGTFGIGRDDDSAIQLEHPSVSRRHALLIVTEAGIEIQDLGSTGGTFRIREVGLGGAAGEQRLAARERVALLPGDTVRIGPALLVLQPRSGVVTAPPPSAEPAADVLRDPGMLKARELATRAAATDLSVLILGETGVGKDLMAEAVHRHSRRAAGPFTILNCAALAEHLIESELFGHERGAFTGADMAKAGLLEASQGGTVFLDEIGEMPLGTQAKLLRVLEDHTALRVGATKSHRIDVRFVAATHRDLRRRVRSGAFRGDLYYRIAGVVVAIPPLRARPSEIEPLARRFIRDFCSAHTLAEPALTREALDVLLGHTWPGNVRELKNAMERAVILSSGDPLQASHIQLDAPPSSAGRGRPAAAPRPAPRASELDDAERARIVLALETCAGNQTRAAKLLGMSRSALLYRLDQFHLPRPKKT